MACQREVIEAIIPAMLPRNDMLNVVNDFTVLLAQ